MENGFTVGSKTHTQLQAKQQQPPPVQALSNMAHFEFPRTPAAMAQSMAMHQAQFCKINWVGISSEPSDLPKAQVRVSMRSRMNLVPTCTVPCLFDTSATSCASVSVRNTGSVEQNGSRVPTKPSRPLGANLGAGSH